MIVEPAHLVGAGGALGAVCRYLLGQWLTHDQFPVGTLTVNAVGSFVLGLVTAAGMSNDVVLFVGVGACGSFTTYSSFSFETVRMWESEHRLRAALYACGTLAVCLIAAGVGGLVVTLR